MIDFVRIFFLFFQSFLEKHLCTLHPYLVCSDLFSILLIILHIPKSLCSGLFRLFHFLRENRNFSLEKIQYDRYHRTQLRKDVPHFDTKDEDERSDVLLPHHFLPAIERSRTIHFESQNLEVSDAITSAPASISNFTISKFGSSPLIA